VEERGIRVWAFGDLGSGGYCLGLEFSEK